MKHAQLCAVAHNLADSMACGMCFVIGMYPVNVFADARRSEGGTITVDFLTGAITQGQASPELAGAARIFAADLPIFCRKHRTSTDDFTELSVSFSSEGGQQLATVSVTDRKGRHSATDYAGLPLKRVRMFDAFGRVRRKPSIA